MQIPSLKRETRYGVPAADLVLFNRYYVLGYSYYFRQAKWALEIIDSENATIERVDNFRPDYRVPEIFRADLADYDNSGYDRGHLVASANKLESKIQNSETFLLSNMSPQRPFFNRGVWKKLENAIRLLNAQQNVLETYVICGPIFYFENKVEMIGSEDDNGVTLPIPHAYFKSILTENHRGTLRVWSFILPNEKTDKSLREYLVSTSDVERLSGLFLWERLVGGKMQKMKGKVSEMWECND